MIRRLFLGLAAAAAFAAAAAVFVFALAFALYAFAETYVGRAGAAAILAAVVATSMLLVGLLLGSAGKSRRRKELSSKELGGLVDRALALLREKPIVAVTAALGAGFMAIRNPTYLGSVIRAFVDGRPTDKRSRSK